MSVVGLCVKSWCLYHRIGAIRIPPAVFEDEVSTGLFVWVG